MSIGRGTSIIGTENRDKKHYMNTTKKLGVETLDLSLGSSW